MNIKKITVIDEIEIQYNKRCISYFETGYSYWYNGREVKNGNYDKKRWKEILNKHNMGLQIKISRNDDYSYEQSMKFENLITQAVRKDRLNNGN